MSLDRREIGRLRVLRDPHIALDGMSGADEMSRTHRGQEPLPCEVQQGFPSVHAGDKPLSYSGKGAFFMSSATRLSELGTDSDRTLSSAEAAEFLGVNPKTLNNWRSQGRGPSYVKYAGAIDGLGRQRGTVGYCLGDLRAYVEAHRVSTPSFDESVSRHISALVDAAPRLSDEQIARLRFALGGAA